MTTTKQTDEHGAGGVRGIPVLIGACVVVLVVAGSGSVRPAGTIAPVCSCSP
jgi:hypothetical protein